MVNPSKPVPVEPSNSVEPHWLPDSILAGLDPYLQWAKATGFRDYATRGASFDRVLDAERIVVAIEVAAGTNVVALNSALNPPGGLSHGVIPDAYLNANARFLTCALKPSAFEQGAWTNISLHIGRLNLALDLLPQRPVPRADGPAFSSKDNWPKAMPEAGGGVVVGIIDTFFAFAHCDLRDASGKTRIAALWDQDPQPAFGPLPGRMPPEFGYGREVNRAALNNHLSKFKLARSLKSLNEDACYDACGYQELRARFAHGTAVAAMIAGPMPTLERVPRAPGLMPRRQVDNPQFSPDLVLVQLPRAAVQDGAGHGLVAHVMDGLRYIVARAAGEQNFVGKAEKRIVVNLSFAYQTGPHDGTSMLEAAIDDLVEQCTARGITLQVVLPTGNTFLDRCHAQFNLTAGKSTTLTLALPPGNEVSTFVEVWLPDERKPTITLVASNGQAHGNVFWSDTGLRGGGNRRMALIAIEPTAVFQNGAGRDQATAAPAGHWKIKITSNVAMTGVHAWTAFNQQNSGAKLRGRQARFVDKQWDPERFLRPALDDKDAAAVVKRRGSISGIATGTTPVVVAGTLRRSRVAPGTSQTSPNPKMHVREHAFYSGARSDTSIAPNRFISAPCEESWALAGVPAAGSRSGSTVRARGTSFSSPQVARYLADPSSSGLLRPTGPAKKGGGTAGTSPLTGGGAFESDDV